MFATWLTALMLALWIKREGAAGRSVLAVPRRWLASLRRGHVLVALGMAGLMLGLVWLMKADGAMIVALGWPEIAAVTAAIDLPALVDLAVIALLAAGQARFGTLHRRSDTKRPRVLRRRTRRALSKRSANDDEDRWRLAA